MHAERTRHRLAAATVGAAALALSVYMPWYGVSFTASGIATAQQAGQQAAAQFGNATLRGYMSRLHEHLAALVGQQFATATGHQALRYTSIALLVLAALALLDALVPLASGSSLLGDGAGASLALLGAVATTLVLYRMISPPSIGESALALSVRGGSWLALASSLTLLGAGAWPRSGKSSPGMLDGGMQHAWSSLSGWTPQR
jgi:hypothetical protein